MEQHEDSVTAAIPTSVTLSVPSDANKPLSNHFPDPVYLRGDSKIIVYALAAPGNPTPGPFRQERERRTFWTSCSSCRKRSKHSIEYRNCNISCVHCSRTFRATEVPRSRKKRATTTENGDSKSFVTSQGTMGKPCKMAPTVETPLRKKVTREINTTLDAGKHGDNLQGIFDELKRDTIMKPNIFRGKVHHDEEPVQIKIGKWMSECDMKVFLMSKAFNMITEGAKIMKKRREPLGFSVKQQQKKADSKVVGESLKQQQKTVDSKVVGESVKQQQQQPKCSNNNVSAATLVKQPKNQRVSSVWTKPNPKFQYGQPLLEATELQSAGFGCAALHIHYMKCCAENKKGIVVNLKRTQLLSSSDSDVFIVGYNDLYDLFTLDGMDVSLLRCLTLSMAVDAKSMDIPVGFLDPQLMAVTTMQSYKVSVVEYVQNALTKYAKKDYIMFAHNTGGHWIAVIVIPKWNKVLYLDSNRSKEHNLGMLKLVLDEAFTTYTSKRKDKPRLTHATKFLCHQQPPGNSCGFYAAHHMMVAMARTNLEDPKEFEVLRAPINLDLIREKIALFLVSQVIDKKGEFYCPEEVCSTR